MKRKIIWLLVMLMVSAGRAEDITICFDGATVKVKNNVADSVSVVVDGAKVNVKSRYYTHPLTLRLTGKSDDGQFVLKTVGEATVTLDGLTLTCREGAPLWLKNKKKVEVVVAKKTENTLTVTACTDTTNHKGAVIWAKDTLLLSGKGTLNIVATGDGCRGIKTKKDLIVEELTLNVTTSGNNLGEKPFGFGGILDFDGQMPDFGGFPPFGNDSTRRAGPPNFNGQTPNFGGFPPFGNDSTRRAGPPNFNGQMPDFGGFPPFGNDSTRRAGPPNFNGQMPDFGGFPPFGNDSISEDGFGGGFGGKHKYYASTKGIASKGKITINSGNVTVHTSTPGAEGIEGKEGLVFNCGTVNVLATDDALNANATIEFNGANVTVRSIGNDAVDANPKNGFFSPFGSGGDNRQKIEPVIIVRGGTVYAWSQVGSPEEGLDCDFAPILIEVGTVFSVGGGMGEMPSVPTNKTAKQPTIVLTGLAIAKDSPICLYNSSNKLIGTVTIPFSMRRSASLITHPAFKLGKTYTIKSQGYEKTFTLNEPFTVVR